MCHMCRKPEYLGNWNRFKLDMHVCQVLGETVTQWFVFDAEQTNEALGLPECIIQTDTRQEALDILASKYASAFAPIDD